MRLRQRVHNSLDDCAHQSGYLLELPSVFHRPAKADRCGRARGTVWETLRENRRKNVGSHKASAKENLQGPTQSFGQKSPLLDTRRKKEKGPLGAFSLNVIPERLCPGSRPIACRDDGIQIPFMKEKALNAIENFKSIDHEMAAVSSTDTVRLTELARERKRMEPIVRTAEEWLKLSSELEALEAMIRGADASLSDLAKEEKPALQAKLQEKEQELRKLFHPRNPKADRNTIVEIRAGAGGDEAGLFVADLYRMYTRFAQSKGLKVDLMSLNSTGVGGIKEVVFEVSGDNAYGWLRFEQGVHRVQRVPETEAQGRIHTSTVTVAVLPEPTEVEIKIDNKDLRIDTYRSSGAGGQHVNKTESAIRITHVPTGVVVACQEERSQGQNKLRAMALLRARMQEVEDEKNFNQRRDLRRKQIGSGDRSEKIRTYNFPQDRITDHRINHSVFNIERFLAGEMDEMFKALEVKELELSERGELSS